jgi:hypothetical protein
VKLLEAEAGVSKATMTRVLARLESMGLISRERHWREFKFHVCRARVLELVSGLTVRTEKGSQASERGLSGLTVSPIRPHSESCTEVPQLRETNEGGGDPPSLSLDGFWEVVPAEKRVKKPEVGKAWNGLGDVERLLAIEWTQAKVASGEECPEARFVLLDRRWEDGEWPVGGRERELERFEADYEDEIWVEGALERLRKHPEIAVTVEAWTEWEKAHG